MIQKGVFKIQFFKNINNSIKERHKNCKKNRCLLNVKLFFVFSIFFHLFYWNLHPVMKWMNKYHIVGASSSYFIQSYVCLTRPSFCISWNNSIFERNHDFLSDLMLKQGVNNVTVAEGQIKILHSCPKSVTFWPTVTNDHRLNDSFTPELLFKEKYRIDPQNLIIQSSPVATLN